MGSGKSTLAKAVSDQLSYKLIDTDNLIEIQTGQTIIEIFETKGEKYFRELESKILIGLSMKENVVISTGGGLPCFNQNMNIIKGSGLCFYIYQSSENLVSRLIKEKEHRPLVKKFNDRSELNTFIRNHISEREKYYFQADFILNGNQDISSLVNDILMFSKNN